MRKAGDKETIVLPGKVQGGVKRSFRDGRIWEGGKQGACRREQKNTGDFSECNELGLQNLHNVLLPSNNICA